MYSCFICQTLLGLTTPYSLPRAGKVFKKIFWTSKPIRQKGFAKSFFFRFQKIFGTLPALGRVLTL
ncbi:MAG: hypothetical protein EBZ53_06825 [Verrucomicrobia bacterium]|nr:hypothetical protein [Verrucomicrobiota bacterium]